MHLPSIAGYKIKIDFNYPCVKETFILCYSISKFVLISFQANVVDVVGDEVVVRHEGEWCAETRVAMTGVRLAPAPGPLPVEYPEGAEVEIYDKFMGAPYSAFWKATIRVNFLLFINCYYVCF